MNALIVTEKNINLPKLKEKIESDPKQNGRMTMNKDPAHIHIKLHEKCLTKVFENFDVYNVLIFDL